MNHSITTGSFNKLWKLSTIVPLQKKVGSNTSLTNYRPVNNLPFLSKIVEKVILEQLQSHIDEHQLLTSRLCAYRPGYSTESVILKITNDVLRSMDLQCVTPLVAIDPVCSIRYHGSQYHDISTKKKIWHYKQCPKMVP